MNLISRWIERKRVDRDLAREMAAHMDEKVDQLIEEGMSEERARAAVRRKFGNVTKQQEESREAWGYVALEQIAQDLRFGAPGAGVSPSSSLSFWL